MIIWRSTNEKMAKSSLIIILILIPITVGLIVELQLNDQQTGGKINILLLGRDAQNPIYSGNTDSITILSIDKKTKKVALLSIPRDSKVNIPGHGMDKINAAYGDGGINLTVTTIENFLNIHIDYYVVIDFEEFKSIVDTLGGINVNVEPQIAAYRPELGQAGVKKLNGDQTLLYARFRQDNEGDIGRVHRHQKIIAEIVKESLEPSNLPKLPSILNQLRENTHTNVPIYDSVMLGKLLMDFDINNAPVEMITGKSQRVNGIYYLIPDRADAEKKVVELDLRD
jgi:LCP family protein required for cell wall assembly